MYNVFYLARLRKKYNREIKQHVIKNPGSSHSPR